MPGYFRIIPEYIASDKSLSGDVKLFYALIEALMSKYGFCFATNEYLMEQSGLSKTTIKRYLRKLIKAGHIVSEVEFRNDRKIWTKLTWNNRDECLKRYKEEMEREAEFNQRFYMKARSGPGGGPGLTTSPTPPNKDDIGELNKRNNINTEGASAPSDHQKSITKQRDWPKPEKKTLEVKCLPKSMTQGSPPTAGSPKMVEDTERIISKPIQVGSQKFLIHQDDRKWFHGFSPYVVEQGLLRVNQASRSGKRISNITAMLFDECAKYRKEAQ